MEKMGYFLLLSLISREACIIYNLWDLEFLIVAISKCKMKPLELTIILCLMENNVEEVFSQRWRFNRGRKKLDMIVSK